MRQSYRGRFGRHVEFLPHQFLQGGAVNDALQSYTGQVYVNDITLDNRTWQVTVQADAPFRGRAEDLYKIKVRGPARNGQPGGMIPIAGLIRIDRAEGPVTVNRYNMYPSADLNGFTVPTLISSGQAVEKMEALARRDLPPGMTFEWTDMAYQQKQAANTRVEVPGAFEFRGDTTLLVFGLSVLVAFLVLAALYESWLLPPAIVLIVPMCLLCAVAGLTVRSLDLNIFVQIGLVVLVGLAANRRLYSSVPVTREADRTKPPTSSVRTPGLSTHPRRSATKHGPWHRCPPGSRSAAR